MIVMVIIFTSFFFFFFEMQLIHGVCGSPLKCSLTVCSKKVSSLLRGSAINDCLIHVGFFPYDVKALLANFYRTILCKRKSVCLRESNFIP